MSKLNYVVKETPYSAYVTIRKKFILSHEAIQPPFMNIHDEKSNISEKEMDSLKERNKVKMFKCLVNTSAVFATPNSEVGTL